MTSARKFTAQPDSVSAARRFVRDALGDHSRELVEAAELMASELATNCVEHAHSDFELVVQSQQQVRVEVRDAHPGEPKLRSPTTSEPKGRGLQIVEAMSDDWGVIRSPAGKTVWFAIGPRAGISSSRRTGAADATPHTLP